jgi:hypothetical protein
MQESICRNSFARGRRTEESGDVRQTLLGGCLLAVLDDDLERAGDNSREGRGDSILAVEESGWRYHDTRTHDAMATTGDERMHLCIQRALSLW